MRRSIRLNKWISVALIVAMIVMTLSVAAVFGKSYTADGITQPVAENGTKISTANEFYNWYNSSGTITSSAYLANDITLQNTSTSSFGFSGQGAHNLGGGAILDGNGHTITLDVDVTAWGALARYDAEDINSAGALFNAIENGAVVRDLNIKFDGSVNIKGGGNDAMQHRRFGILAGVLREGSTVENVHVTMTADSVIRIVENNDTPETNGGTYRYYVGGLVGHTSGAENTMRGVSLVLEQNASILCRVSSGTDNRKPFSSWHTYKYLYLGGIVGHNDASTLTGVTLDIGRGRIFGAGHEMQNKGSWAQGSGFGETFINLGGIAGASRQRVSDVYIKSAVTVARNNGDLKGPGEDSPYVDGSCIRDYDTGLYNPNYDQNIVADYWRGSSVAIGVARSLEMSQEENGQWLGITVFDSLTGTGIKSGFRTHGGSADESVGNPLPVSGRFYESESGAAKGGSNVSTINSENGAGFRFHYDGTALKGNLYKIDYVKGEIVWSTSVNASSTTCYLEKIPSYKGKVVDLASGHTLGADFGVYMTIDNSQFYLGYGLVDNNYTVSYDNTDKAVKLRYKTDYAGSIASPYLEGPETIYRNAGRHNSFKTNAETNVSSRPFLYYDNTGIEDIVLNITPGVLPQDTNAISGLINVNGENKVYDGTTSFDKNNVTVDSTTGFEGEEVKLSVNFVAYNNANVMTSEHVGADSIVVTLKLDNSNYVFDNNQATKEFKKYEWSEGGNVGINPRPAEVYLNRATASLYDERVISIDDSRTKGFIMNDTLRLCATEDYLVDGTSGKTIISFNVALDKMALALEVSSGADNTLARNYDIKMYSNDGVYEGVPAEECMLDIAPQAVYVDTGITVTSSTGQPYNTGDTFEILDKADKYTIEAQVEEGVGLNVDGYKLLLSGKQVAHVKDGEFSGDKLTFTKSDVVFDRKVDTIVYATTRQTLEIKTTAEPSAGGKADISEYPANSWSEEDKKNIIVYGDKMTVKATANDGYKFLGWYIGETCISTDAEYQYIATGNATLEARFAEKTETGVEVKYYVYGGEIAKEAYLVGELENITSVIEANAPSADDMLFNKFINEWTIEVVDGVYIATAQYTSTHTVTVTIGDKAIEVGFNTEITVTANESEANEAEHVYYMANPDRVWTINGMLMNKGADSYTFSAIGEHYTVGTVDEVGGRYALLDAYEAENSEGKTDIYFTVTTNATVHGNLGVVLRCDNGQVYKVMALKTDNPHQFIVKLDSTALGANEKVEDVRVVLEHVTETLLPSGELAIAKSYMSYGEAYKLADILVKGNGKQMAVTADKLGVGISSHTDQFIGDVEGIF